jgi:hypothetical protein
MSQFMGPEHEEDADEMRDLARRTRDLHLRIAESALSSPRQRNYSDKDKIPTAGHAWSGRYGGARDGRAPWDPDSDSDSDDGRRDTTRLTEDGQHVISKQYKLIDGHWALTTTRLELHEVDPFLLIKLRDKRDKALAKYEEKKRRKEEKKKRMKNQESGRDGQWRESAVPLTPSRSAAAAADPEEKKTPASHLTRSATTRTYRIITEEQREEQCEEQEKLQRAREKMGNKPFLDPTPPPSPPQVPVEEIQRRISLSRSASQPIPESLKKQLRRMPLPSSPAMPIRAKSRRQQLQHDSYFAAAAVAPSSPLSRGPTVRWGGDQESQQKLLRESQSLQRAQEQNKEPAQAENSAAPARRALRRMKKGAWVERFAEDIAYDSTDSGADADNSDAAVHHVPKRRPSRKSKAASHRTSQSRVDESEDDLDIWQKIFDDSAKGKTPRRRAKGNFI